MSNIQEYIGCKSIESVNYDSKGNDLYNIWITDEEIIRCRDCKHCIENRRLSPLGEYYEYLSCRHLEGLTVRAIKPDGFCAWAERRDERSK